MKIPVGLSPSSFSLPRVFGRSRHQRSHRRTRPRANDVVRRTELDPNLSMSCPNQHVMRINFRRMDHRTSLNYQLSHPIGKEATRTARNAPRRNWAKHRREVRNGRIGFVCLASAICDPQVDARPRGGRSAVALAEDVSARPVSARAALYARPRTEMAREAHTALSANPGRPPAASRGDRQHDGQRFDGLDKRVEECRRDSGRSAVQVIAVLPRNAPARILTAIRRAGHRVRRHGRACAGRLAISPASRSRSGAESLLE
jgi:hypothetical protein